MSKQEEQKKNYHTAEQVKQYNNHARDRFDCATVRLPKGTKEKAKKYGYSTNRLINELVKGWLDAHPDDEPPKKETTTKSKKTDDKPGYFEGRPLPFD